ncbi:MAG: DUF302 domain-containing protein [Hyphomicrobiales bacterium]|nr:DUF302 domain-containing protein [Hyphomicrobiales bacterium]
MRMLLAGLALFFAFATAAQADGHIVVKQSNHSVAKTLDRLAEILKSKGATVFARVDHAAGAKKIGTDMKPTQLLIFGNPKLGTPLMQAERKIGLDLPMKALAWEDDAGKVWLAYGAPADLKTRYQVSGQDKVFGKMTGVLGKLTDAAIKAE